MSVVKALEIEVEKAELLFGKVKECLPKLSNEFPTWADVGEAKRFNALLEEIIEIYQYHQ